MIPPGLDSVDRRRDQQRGATQGFQVLDGTICSNDRLQYHRSLDVRNHGQLGINRLRLVKRLGGNDIPTSAHHLRCGRRVHDRRCWRRWRGFPAPGYAARNCVTPSPKSRGDSRHKGPYWPGLRLRRLRWFINSCDGRWNTDGLSKFIHPRVVRNRFRDLAGRLRRRRTRRRGDVDLGNQQLPWQCLSINKWNKNEHAHQQRLGNVCQRNGRALPVAGLLGGVNQVNQKARQVQ